MKMKLSKNEAYAEATGTIRIMEKQLLTDHSVERVLDATNVEETIRLLSQNCSCDFAEDISANQIEEILQEDFLNTCDIIDHLCPDPHIVELIKQRQLFHNKKVETKSKIAGTDEGLMIEIGNVPDFSEPLSEDVTDPQEIDMLWDQQMYEVLLNICEELDNDFITEYYRKEIDFYNARLMLRAKNMNKPLSRVQAFFIDGGKTPKVMFSELYDQPHNAIKDKLFYQYYGKEAGLGLDAYEDSGNLGVLEMHFDNLLMDHVKSSRYVAFGPEVAFAFLVAKENEIGQIRLILTCKSNEIPNDTIRERLRDSYA